MRLFLFQEKTKLLGLCLVVFGAVVVFGGVCGRSFCFFCLLFVLGALGLWVGSGHLVRKSFVVIIPLSKVKTKTEVWKVFFWRGAIEFFMSWSGSFWNLLLSRDTHREDNSHSLFSVFFFF